MPASARDPYDVPLTEEQRQALALWCIQEIDHAEAARGATVSEVDYWHRLYLQGRTRSTRTSPWPDAADLTSYLSTEKVDALQARLMKTVWQSPVWIVEGWGEAAERSPAVEEFHQWTAEQERLQTVLDRASLMALIEPRALVEVFEASERVVRRKTIQASIQTAPDGGWQFDEEGNPKLQQNDAGEYVEAVEGQPAAEITVDVAEVVRKGPSYRVLPYRDSLIFPAHARDPGDIWGYGKRIFMRRSELRRRVESGVYDAEAVAKIKSVSDRESTPTHVESGLVVTADDVETMEVELWELLLLVDVNAILDTRSQKPLRGKAYRTARWYVITVCPSQQVLLRFQHDDFEQSRYIPIILFPRTDRLTEGLSFVGHKLITTIEEHTAYRNMAADRSAMAASAPVLRMMSALWNPMVQPWGPRQTIDVRDPREIMPVQVPDVPVSVWQGIDRCERTAERIAGVNDIASGQVAQETRTWGEIQLATEQSFVRMDLIVRRFQEALEDLGQVRHAIWQRVLRERPEGIQASESLIAGMEGRGVPIDQYLPNGRVMAGLLEGSFRFKPYGSVETADLKAQRADWQAAIQTLPILLQLFPSLAQRFQTPRAAAVFARHFCKVFRLPAVQAFVGSPAQQLSDLQQLQQMPIPGWLPPPPPPQQGGAPPTMPPAAIGPMVPMQGGVTPLTQQQ